MVKKKNKKKKTKIKEVKGQYEKRKNQQEKK